MTAAGSGTAGARDRACARKTLPGSKILSDAPKCMLHFFACHRAGQEVVCDQIKVWQCERVELKASKLEYK